MKRAICITKTIPIRARPVIWCTKRHSRSAVQHPSDSWGQHLSRPHFIVVRQIGDHQHWLSPAYVGGLWALAGSTDQ